MNKIIQCDIKILETIYDFYKGGINRTTKIKIKNVIDLYDDRKII